MSVKEDRFCRICHGSEDPELGVLFSPCKCTGSMRFVHVECLNQWRRSSSNPASYFKCDTCKYSYLLYRPRLSYMLRSSKFVAGVSFLWFSSVILGRFILWHFLTISGSLASFIRKEDWTLQDSVTYGLSCIGCVSIVHDPALVLVLLRKIIGTKQGDSDFLKISAVLLLKGAVTMFASLYSTVQRTCNRCIQYFGDRILEVPQESE